MISNWPKLSEGGGLWIVNSANPLRNFGFCCTKQIVLEKLAVPKLKDIRRNKKSRVLWEEPSRFHPQCSYKKSVLELPYFQCLSLSQPITQKPGWRYACVMTEKSMRDRMALWKVMKIWYFKYTFCYSFTVSRPFERYPHPAKPSPLPGETPTPTQRRGRRGVQTAEFACTIQILQ